MNADFINELLRKADPYIRQYGREEGYHKFREYDARSMSASLTMEDITKAYIESINNQEADAPFYSRWLLGAYAYYEQQNVATPTILKEWVLDRLMRISEGETPNVALSLKSRTGQQQTKPMYNQMRCACFVALKMRGGLNKSQAISEYGQELGISERHVHRLLRGIDISDEISDETLVFFRDTNVWDDYYGY